MRHATASQLLGRRHAPISNAPREGTKLREVYDLFQANKGRVISFTRPSAYITESLVDYYGLDLRCIGYGKWVLAGEWFGKVYLDYLAAKPIVVQGEDHIDPKGEWGRCEPRKTAGKINCQTKAHPMATPRRFIDLRGF